MVAVIGIVYFAIIIFCIAGVWKTLVKAGQPGWACLIPFYNIYVMVEIARRPILYFVLCFIPVVNLVIIILISIDIAKRFGKSAGFGIGLTFLGFIFYPILGFGDATYDGNSNFN
mgnify:CR=1 FL=1